MEWHFAIKSGRPIKMALVIINFVTEFPNKAKEPVCQISVGIFRPKYADHLRRWSPIFRPEETEMNLFNWIPTEISGIFGKMESTLSRIFPSFSCGTFRHVTFRPIFDVQNHKWNQEPQSGRKGYSPTTRAPDDVDNMRILLLESNKMAEQWPLME